MSDSWVNNWVDVVILRAVTVDVVLLRAVRVAVVLRRPSRPTPSGATCTERRFFGLPRSLWGCLWRPSAAFDDRSVLTHCADQPRRSLSGPELQAAFGGVR